jgi:hypothetical protein
MATPELSAVVALTNKILELEHAGHRARSSEYTQRALAAAHALGATDCLIVARLQLGQVGILFATVYHQTHYLPLAAPPFAPMLAPFFEAAATVQRRRAAGTLLAGSCRAAEVTYERLTNKHVAKLRQLSEQSGRTAATAPLIGFKAFLSAANSAVLVLSIDNTPLLSLTQQQQRLCVVLIADAVELMMQPRIFEGDLCVGEEGVFAEGMRAFVQAPERFMHHGADGARLLHSWLRLKQSGVLQRRGVDVAFRSTAPHGQAIWTAAAAAAAAPGLRHCALASCDAREAHPSHFKSCAACRIPVYCCKAHQTEHWPSHKAACKAARKAAAEKG